MWRAPTVRALALELSFLFLGESCSQEDRLQASQDCFSRGEFQNPSVHCACFSLLFTLHLRPLAPPPPPHTHKEAGFLCCQPRIPTVVLCGGSFPSLDSRVPLLLVSSQQFSGDKSPSPARQIFSGQIASTLSSAHPTLSSARELLLFLAQSWVQCRRELRSLLHVVLGFSRWVAWGSEGWLGWRLPRGFS